MKHYLRHQGTVETLIRIEDSTQRKIQLLEESKDTVLQNKNSFTGKNTPSERAMLAWIDAEIKKFKKVLEDEAAEYELNEIEKLAINNICTGKPEKRKRLTEYLKLNKDQKKSEIRDKFEDKYGLKRATFYNWTKELEEEMKSISRTENEAK